MFSGLDAVPSECAYTRFQRRLFDEQEVQQLFHDAADRLGQSLAIDGKELHSQANGPVRTQDDHRQEHTDRRREH